MAGQVNHVGAVAGQMITHVQEPARLDLQAGLLPHLPHQRGSQGAVPVVPHSGQSGAGPAGGVSAETPMIVSNMNLM